MDNNKPQLESLDDLPNQEEVETDLSHEHIQAFAPSNQGMEQALCENKSTGINISLSSKYITAQELLELALQAHDVLRNKKEKEVSYTG